MDKKNSSLVSSEIVGRIRRLLVDNGLLEKDLVEYLGIGGETFNNWKKNRSDSYLHYLVEISDFFHVTTDYLLTGDREFSKEDNGYSITAQEMDIIKKYRKIKLNERKYVDALMNSMIS